MPALGNKITGATPDALTITNEGVSYCTDSAAADGWAYAVGGRVGRSGASTPDTRFYIHQANASKQPEDKLAEGATFAPSTQMTGGADGTVYTRDLTAALKLNLGVNYCPTVQSEDGFPLTVGMSGSASIPGRETYMFFWDTDSTIPLTDPFDIDSSSSEGHLALWIEYETNVKPDPPVVTAPANGSTPSDATPVITATFADANELLPNGLTADELRRARVIVKRQSDGVGMWDHTYDVEPSEAAAGASSIEYAGTALANGVTYTIQVYHYDLHLERSNVSATSTFTLVQGGTATPTAPTAKQETKTPGPFTATWTHPTPLNANAAEVRLRSGSPTGSIARTMAALKTGLAVASGGTISISWADTGFAALNPGTTYYPEMRGRDTANNLGGWTVAGTPFSVDAVPSTPSGLSPTGGVASTTYPLLTVLATDADDTVASGLVVKARIKNAAGTVLGTYSMALRSGTTNTWDLQTSATHLATFADYRWDAYSYDGTFYSGSGGITVEADAQKSAEVSFSYVSGPAVTISAPTEAADITTATISVTHAVTGTQTKRRVRLWLGTSATGDAIYDTTMETTAATVTVIPSGYTLNGLDYTIVVSVEDNLGFTGTSAERHVTIDYVEPAALTNVQIIPWQLPGDVDASAAKISHDASVDPAFDRYVYRRRPADAVAGSSREKILKEVYDSVTVNYVDANPSSYKEYVYSVSQVTRIGADELESPRVEVLFSVRFDATVIQNAQDPSQRVVLRFRGERRVPRLQTRTLVPVWNSEAPVMLFDGMRYRRITCEFTIYDIDVDGYLDPDVVEGRIQAVEDLFYVDPLSPHTLIWRDARQRELHGHLESMEEMDPTGSNLRRLALTFVQLREAAS